MAVNPIRQLSPLLLTPQGTPGSLSSGEVWIDSTTNRINSYDGSASQQYVAKADLYNGCKAYNNGTQSIPNNSSTAITFNTNEWDTGSIHSTSTNTSRFTVPTSLGGHWQFVWKVNVPSSANVIVFLRKNGGTDANNVIGSAVQFATVKFGGACTANLAAGDYIELYLYQATGSSMTIGNSIGTTAGADVNFMEARYLG